MWMRIQGVVGLLGFIVSLAPAQTAGPIEKRDGFWVQEVTGSMAAPLRLTASATADINLQGANVDRVSYRVALAVKASNEAEARAILERAAPAVSRRGPYATLALADPVCGRCAFSARLEIETPRNLREAILTTQAGQVEAVGISGAISVDSAAGSIRLNAIGGGVRASTAGGHIELGSIGGPVRCETAGGSISLNKSAGDATLTSNGKITVGSVGGLLRAETLGGDVQAESVGGSVIASTLGGGIRIGDAGGSVNADTAGGSIEVGRAVQGVRAATAAGDIRLSEAAGQVYAASAGGNIHAYFVNGGRLRNSLIETTAGAIVVWLPADLGVVIDAQIDFARGAGRIESEFADIVVSESQDPFAPRALRAGGALNGGGPTLTIRNTSGRIQIRRR